MVSIKVNWPDVETAFERNSPGLTSYIDRVTGEVLVVLDGAPEDAEKRELLLHQPDRYVKIDPASSREQYRWMERFVVTVEDDALRDRLLVSIDGKGAFRRFKDVLLSYPAERERWFTHRADLLRYHVNRWFESRDLEPDPPPPWGNVELPPEPVDPLPRVNSTGEGPAEVLRKQVKSLVDVLPAGELHSARVFLEYLRDRGSAELNGSRGKLDPRRPFRRRSDGGLTESDLAELAEEDEVEDPVENQPTEPLHALR
ncbi:MAG: hypothetical protein IT371_19175 [Deltaproteobacteria bacterium]|nr:hypothetical protein [Deltaproteobacteria bacterium]